VLVFLPGSDFECRTVRGISTVENSANGKCLKKHLSFDQICEVARMERKKLLGHGMISGVFTKRKGRAVWPHMI
jgi:hypothetical protein